MKTNTKQNVTLAMLSAVSIMLVALIRIPFPGAPFLEYDPADVSIIIATLLFGPASGIIVTLIVSILQGITVSSSSGIIGIIMHIFSTGIYVLVIGLINKKGNNRVVLAVSLGALAMTLSMIVWNMIFTPLFMGQPFETVKAMLLPIIIPFNLIKSVLNGMIAVPVYFIIKKAKII